MTTPLMKQYLEVKEGHQDCVLLYRMGDFYELFNDDAVVASKVLGLTLTSRNNGSEAKTPLAGFPHHSIEKHMPKLVNAGYKVAICEQVEDPATAKGIVKRDVVEIITKGTTFNDQCLDAKSNNYIAAVFPGKESMGLACMDVSTGQYFTAESTEAQVRDELFRLDAQEVLIPDEMNLTGAWEDLKENGSMVFSELDKSYFHVKQGAKLLCRQFEVHSLETFGIQDDSLAVGAAGAVLQYVKETKKTDLKHLIRLEHRQFSSQMSLDMTTIRNLELIRPIHTDDESGTLFYHLDATSTAMGGRLLKEWITHPLLDIAGIEERQDAVQELFENQNVLMNIRQLLREVNDIERILARVGSKRANARDIQGLGRSLARASEASAPLAGLKGEIFKSCHDILSPLKAWGDELMEKIADAPPMTIREGGILNPQYYTELLQIKQDALEGKQWLSSLEGKVKEETGIPKIKISYNKVFGYYIEVSRLHSEKVPDYFIRKQTLVNAERFITPEMKEWESRILNAETRSNSLEYDLFCQLRDEVEAKTSLLTEAGRAIATIDVLASLAHVALKNDWHRPSVDDSDRISIVAGRHPVVEALSEPGTYIANDVHIDRKKRQIQLITGPNMAGKSTYLRQVGLITLLAQIGSYVPAKSAEIGVVDRIFTRVGAADRLSRGQSTFMVEMIETSSILHNATADSLILLDEIGRGTSTFDGLSLAWAIVEHLHETDKCAARTLFATHYHELTELPDKFDRIVNIQVAVKETDGRVIFLRKILEGACDSSYGIQVASMAGLGKSIVSRAWEILEHLEKDKHVSPSKAPRRVVETPSVQASLFGAELDPETREKLEQAETYKEVYDKVRHLNLNSMTPLELMNEIQQLQQGSD